MSEEVSGALPSLISLTVSVDVKPYLLLRFSSVSRCSRLSVEVKQSTQVSTVNLHFILQMFRHMILLL